MFDTFRQWSERLLRIPHDPEPPPGDQASTRIFRAAPNYYRYLLVLWALKNALGFFIVVVGAAFPMGLGVFELIKHGRKWGMFLGVIPALLLILDLFAAVFTLAIVRLEFEKRWYLVTDCSLRIREGVVKVREMTVNFANIQNISISQGPIQRMLGIADLRVDTAGGGGASPGKENASENLHTAWFRGVNNANEIREVIQQRLHHLKDSGLGDNEEMAASVNAAGHARVGFTSSPELLNVLREINTETRALRSAVEE